MVDEELNQWMKDLRVSSLYVSPKVNDLVMEDEAREIKKEMFINRLDNLSELLNPKIKKLWDVLTK